MAYNIFVAFTKAQLIHIKNVISAENFSDYILVSRFDVDDDLQNGSCATYILNGHLFKIRKIWLTLEQDIESRGEANLYIAHSFNVFTQGIQHALLKKNKLNNLNVFPDGNLLFNNFSIPYLAREHFIKKMASFFLLTKYKFFKGSIISPFMPINNVYSYLPAVTCNYKQLKLISMSKLGIKKSSSNNTLLILGHRNQKVISPAKLLAVLLDNNHISKILYKPHPRLLLADDLFYKALKSEFGDTINLIDDDRPVESLIDLYPISNLFAVASSSLITLKILLPHVEVNYFGLKEYLGQHFDPLIKKQFDELGLIEWS